MLPTGCLQIDPLTSKKFHNYESAALHTQALESAQPPVYTDCQPISIIKYKNILSPKNLILMQTTKLHKFTGKHLSINIFYIFKNTFKYFDWQPQAPPCSIKKQLSGARFSAQFKLGARFENCARLTTTTFPHFNSFMIIMSRQRRI